MVTNISSTEMSASESIAPARGTPWGAHGELDQNRRAAILAGDPPIPARIAELKRGKSKTDGSRESKVRPRIWEGRRDQIDIGFGDAITSAAVELDFPTLLDDSSPRLKAYPKETVVAEKLQAIVAFGQVNSRMKGDYDLRSGTAVPSTYCYRIAAISVPESTDGRSASCMCGPGELTAVLLRGYGSGRPTWLVAEMN